MDINRGRAFQLNVSQKVIKFQICQRGASKALLMVGLSNFKNGVGFKGFLNRHKKHYIRVLVLFLL